MSEWATKPRTRWWGRVFSFHFTQALVLERPQRTLHPPWNSMCIDILFYKFSEKAKWDSVWWWKRPFLPEQTEETLIRISGEKLGFSSEMSSLHIKEAISKTYCRITPRAEMIILLCTFHLVWSYLLFGQKCALGSSAPIERKLAESIIKEFSLWRLPLNTPSSFGFVRQWYLYSHYLPSVSLWGRQSYHHKTNGNMKSGCNGWIVPPPQKKIC